MPLDAGRERGNRRLVIGAVLAVALGVAAGTWATAPRGRESCGRRRPTLIGLGVTLAYAVISVIYHEWFAPALLVGLIALLGYGLVPMVSAIAIGVVSMSSERGHDHAVALFAWLGLLLALPGSLALAAARATGPWAC